MGPHPCGVDPQRPIRVVIADDEPLMLKLLQHTIDGMPGLELVGAAEDAEGAIRLVELHQPDVALIDVRMPGGGLRAARVIASRSDTRVVALSAISDQTSVTSMLHAGAVGYLVKGGSIDEILDAIVSAAAGEPIRVPSAVGRPAAPTSRAAASS